jgi:hypothetical protein
MANVNPVQVQKFLSGMNYPAGKKDIVSHAKSEGADSNVLGILNKLPKDARYQTPADVSQAIGKLE